MRDFFWGVSMTVAIILMFVTSGVAVVVTLFHMDGAVSNLQWIGALLACAASHLICWWLQRYE